MAGIPPVVAGYPPMMAGSSRIVAVDSPAMAAFPLDKAGLWAVHGGHAPIHGGPHAAGGGLLVLQPATTSVPPATARACVRLPNLGTLILMGSPWGGGRVLRVSLVCIAFGCVAVRIGVGCSGGNGRVGPPPLD